MYRRYKKIRVWKPELFKFEVAQKSLEQIVSDIPTHTNVKFDKETECNFVALGEHGIKCLEGQSHFVAQSCSEIL